MQCKKLHKKLIFFLEGDLPGHEMEQVKQHLTECNECAAFASEMSKTLNVLQAEKSPEVNPFFYTRVKARLESQTEKPAQFMRNPFLARVLQPAFFSLLLLAGIYTGIKIGQPADTGASYFQQEQVVPYLNEMEAEPIEAFLME
ncbi:Putative zinc-finger [Tangfeifania diversioriginum]|uniref:Putative zinc-finger n=1 Tax=Tangfeifania diversioriginum TaxID=1168035 RepID=A0A1M6P0J2_9BACT|nr:zf-HC2 domain-containing protein [Tangfeifania diversioriginum]SHK01509.1 Putative zinc-finger [Tangfeifania diversioriginum]